jgi:hypothetical protein
MMMMMKLVVWWPRVSAVAENKMFAVPHPWAADAPLSLAPHRLAHSPAQET